MNLLRLFQHPKELVDLTPSELDERLPSYAAVVDVRTPREYQQGHIPGAISIPLGREGSLAGRWPQEAELVLICKTGHRSQAAAATLLGMGFQRVSHLKGGMGAWNKAGLRVE